MDCTRDYTLSWSFLGTTRIRHKPDSTPLCVKRKYRILCYCIECLGWIPAALFELVWKVHPRSLCGLLSIACFFAFFYAVQYGFHLFLCTMNRNGKLPKYIEADL